MTPAKDEVLAALAGRANVAQFVSFGPGDDPAPRFVRLRDLPPETAGLDPRAAIEALFERAAARTVNVRTFRVDDPGGGKGRAFHYGIEGVENALALVRRHAGEGLHTIVNETIPVDDGGVSGVAMGGILEFSPDDTPRCVEKPGTLALPYDEARSLLEIVYGFRPEVVPAADQRMEWSIHPRRVGLHHTQTLVWELEQVEPTSVQAQPRWPNNFSRLLGDKVFGLLVAQLLGVPVPRTLVVGRRVAPFAFGVPTGLAERWLRTAPREPVPGRYPTTLGWQDPFALLGRVDPDGEVAAVLAQDAVDARWSGALLLSSDDEFAFDGVRGRGDRLMVGEAAPEDLPDGVVHTVLETARGLTKTLGPVRMEWALDASAVWVLQLQQVAVTSSGTTIVAGSPRRWRSFDVTLGLEGLRALIADLEGAREGIVLHGNVGVTSHFGDLLRRAGIPSRIEPPARGDAARGEPRT